MHKFFYFGWNDANVNTESNAAMLFLAAIKNLSLFSSKLKLFNDYFLNALKWGNFNLEEVFVGKLTLKTTYDP